MALQESSQTTIIQEHPDEPDASVKNVISLPDDKFKERFDFIQEDVRIRATLNNLPNMDVTKAEVMSFIAKSKQHPIGMVTQYAVLKSTPICNYYCYEIPGAKQ